MVSVVDSTPTGGNLMFFAQTSKTPWFKFRLEMWIWSCHEKLDLNVGKDLGYVPEIIKKIIQFGFWFSPVRPFVYSKGTKKWRFVSNCYCKWKLHLLNLIFFNKWKIRVSILQKQWQPFLLHQFPDEYSANLDWRVCGQQWIIDCFVIMKTVLFFRVQCHVYCIDFWSSFSFWPFLQIGP